MTLVISPLSRIFSPLRLTSHVFLETPILVRQIRRRKCGHTHSCILAVLTEQVAGGIVVPGSGRLITCLGVDDLVIVDMPDTLLVTTRARSQEVKRLVKRAKDAGWKQLL